MNRLPYIIKGITLILIIIVMVSACREIEGLPEDSAPVEPVEEEAVAEEKVEDDVLDDKTVIDEDLEESIQEEEPPLSLNFDHAKVYVLSSDQVDTLHDAIVEPVVEDQALIEAMFTDPRLADLREHLSAYVYNTSLGSIGMIREPSSLYVLCNKLNKLSDTYEPSMLRVPDVDFSFSNWDMKKQMRPVAGLALDKMFDAALEEDIRIVAVSGYRSYARQAEVYGYKAATRGIEAADKVSARPGHSEHQTGLTIDVSSRSAGYALEEIFGETEEGVWLANNAHKYGFVIRYPKDKIDITGYAYEPWHLRYIGEDVADFLYEHQLVLEEVYTVLLTHK